MRTMSHARRVAAIAALAVLAAVAAPIASRGATTKKARLIAATGNARHVLATSALLTASVTPDGSETSYYFQWGTTASYGAQTATVKVGSGTSKVKVAQAIGGLVTGTTYHYRVVATTASGATADGRDRTFTAGQRRPKFDLPKAADVTAGMPFDLGGTLTGLGNAGHSVALQASSYPYKEAFKTIGAPTVTDAQGRFAFHLAPISTSTDYRVITLDARPLYSRTETVRLAPRVTLRVRTSKSGLVRLYGTVTPAAVGRTVLFQLHATPKANIHRPGSEAAARFITQFSTVVKKGGRTFSRFSLVVKVRTTGRYRAAVKLPRKGPLISGYSSTVVLRAAPGTDAGSRRKG